MKFTRIFLLKAICVRENDNDQNPLEVIKKLIISHPHIDLALALLLSLLLMITKYNDDINYTYTSSINIYFITSVNLTTLIYYFCLEYLDQITMINLKKKLNISNLNNNNTTNTQDQNNEGSEFPLLIIKNTSEIKVPEVLFNYWHTFKTCLYLIKIYFSTITYFISLIFCVIYNDQKNKMDKDKFLLIHLMILDFYEFYSGFRICYFLIKILINIYLIPIFISSVILGVFEDKFNQKLNKLVNSKYYTGRTSLTVQNGRTSELEEYCSICLNNFVLDEMVSTLPCSRRHTFHTFCLEKWFLTTVTCPLCRSDFQNSIDLHFNVSHINDRIQGDIELNQHLI